MRILTNVAVLVTGLACPLAGQRAVIRGGTPGAVVDLLKAELLPQKFAFVNANQKAALFTLDRGLLAQTGTVRGNAQVVLELRARFKPTSAGLEVTLLEEVTTVFPASRVVVRSPKELENLQRLLDRIKGIIEANATAADSSPRPQHPDSVRPN
jgi:hypothetical protein